MAFESMLVAWRHRARRSELRPLGLCLSVLAMAAASAVAPADPVAAESILVTGHATTRSPEERCGWDSALLQRCLRKPKPEATADGATRAAIFEAALRAKGDTRTIIGLRAAVDTLRENPGVGRQALLEAQSDAGDRYDRMVMSAAGGTRIPFVDSVLGGAGEGLGSAFGTLLGAPAGPVAIAILKDAGKRSFGEAGQNASDALHLLIDPGNRRQSQEALFQSNQYERRYGVATLTEIFALAEDYPILAAPLEVALDPYGAAPDLDISVFEESLKRANPEIVLPEITGTQKRILATATDAASAGSMALEEMRKLGTALKAEAAERSRVEQDAKAAEAKRLRMQTYVESSRGLLLGVQSVLALSDPEAARDLGVVSDGAFKVYDAIATFTPMLDQEGGLSSIAAIGMTGNFIGVAMSLVSLTGSSGPSADEMILQQLSLLRAQIADMDKMIRENFQHLDLRLDEITLRMDEGFSLLVRMLDGQGDYLAEIEDNTVAMRTELQLAVENLRIYEQNLAEMLGPNTHACLNHDFIDDRLHGRRGADLGVTAGQVWDECAGSYVNFLSNALDSELFAGTRIDDVDEIDGALAKLGFGSLQRPVPDLAGAAQEVVTLYSIARLLKDPLADRDFPRSPNPVVWPDYARKYLSFALQMETYFAAMPDVRPKRSKATATVIEAGAKVEPVIAELSPVTDPALYAALVERYRASVDKLADALEDLRYGYEESDQGLKGWTWEQFGWTSGEAETVDAHPVRPKSPDGDEDPAGSTKDGGTVKSIGSYYPGIPKKKLSFPPCSGKGTAIQLSAELFMPIVGAGDRLTAPLHDFGLSRIDGCYRAAKPTPDRKSPRGYGFNDEKTRTWFNYNGHAAIEILVYETGDEKPSGKARFVARYEEKKVTIVAKTECDTPLPPLSDVFEEYDKARLDGWVRSGGPVQTDGGCYSNERDLTKVADIVAEINSKGAGAYAFVPTKGKVPTLGTSIADRSEALRAEHTRRFDRIGRIAINTPGRDRASLDPDESLDELVKEIMKKTIAVNEAALEVYHNKALILAMLNLGVPDLLVTDPDLSRFFYSTRSADLMLDPAMLLDERRTPTTPLVRANWIRARGKQDAEAFLAHVRALNVAVSMSVAGPRTSFDSPFSRTMNDLRALEALQLESEGLLER